MKRKMISVLAAGMIAVPFLAAGDELITREDFKVSDQWVPKKFMDRDFWPIVPVSLYQPSGKSRQEYEDNLRGVTFQPTSGMSPAMRKTMELPAFNDAAAILPSMAYPAMLEKGKDGVWRYKYDNFVPKGIVQPTRPFFLNTMRLTRALGARPSYARLFYFDSFDHDMKAFSKWNQKYPQYAGTMFAGEWGNNALNIQSYSKHRNFQKVLSKDDYKNIEKTYLHNPDFKTSKDYIDKRLKPYFDRSAYVFPYPGKMVLEGVDNIAHLAAEWGKGTVGVLAMESSRPNVRWQMQMMHTRGAARQYDTRWAWYIASFYTGIDYNGKRVVDSECTAWQISPKTGPDCGLSLSLRRRVFYLSYFSGANYMQREDADRNFFDYSKKGADRWKPAAEGQMYIDFFNFTRKNPDRGTPYTPVAILTGRNRGTWRDLGNSFRFLPNVPIKHSDFMFNGFMASILPSAPYLPGGEYSLRNGKYGDGFDMLTPDSHDDLQFASTLNSYKAAILAGEYEETPARIKLLTEYVKKGGTLVVCAKQLEKWNPGITGVKLTGKTVESEKYLLDTVTTGRGVKVLLEDKNNNPLILRKKYGDGCFIIGTPRWFAPCFDEEFKPLARQAMSNMLRGKTKYPYAEWILERLVDQALPVKVSGNIQYGINKTADGWWIYLINNDGVKKYPTRAPVFDKLKKSRVVIDLKDLEAASVKELFSEKNLPVKDGKITVSVEPGDIAVCRIIEKKKDRSR